MTELHAVNGDNDTDTQSWDDFWTEAAPPQRTEVICGVEVLVPTDFPLNLAARLERLEESEDEDDLHELVGLLFGEGALADWVAAGMTTRQFQVAFAWGIAHASGQPLTFAEAYERVTAADEGKAPGNRATRRAAARAAARPRSASTGGRSKRTSSGSTASTSRPTPGV